jgi:outer membrane lipoprotein-sorting protein
MRSRFDRFSGRMTSMKARMVAIALLAASSAAQAQAPAPPAAAPQPILAAPAAQAGAPARPAQARPPAPRKASIPSPPRRPAGLGAALAARPDAPLAAAMAQAAAPPPQTAQAPMRLQDEAQPPAQIQPVRAAPAGPLSEEAALDRVNAYMNSFRTLIADFVQFGADGRKYEGTLYIHRPGRMRFEYKPPATIEVISDGTTVAVRDKRLATQDNYLIGQTPLKFLLKEQIDLRRDVKILRVVSTAEAIRVTVEDRATLGGTSRITLHYDPRANVLRQWVIVDPQGYETSVQVANLDTARRPDPGLFRINLERLIGDNR